MIRRPTCSSPMGTAPTAGSRATREWRRRTTSLRIMGSGERANKRVPRPANAGERTSTRESGPWSYRPVRRLLQLVHQVSQLNTWFPPALLWSTISNPVLTQTLDRLKTGDSDLGRDRRSVCESDLCVLDLD